jgi:C1A family cysteine protease
MKQRKMVGIIRSLLVLLVLTLLVSFAAFSQDSKERRALQEARPTGGPTFGGRLERPSRAKVERLRRQAEENLRGFSRQLPTTQDERRLRANPAALASVTDAHFSWRDMHMVTEARNQNPCGSCWAFGAVAALEGNWAIRHGDALINASEQQVLDCTPEGDDCNGGLLSDAMEYLVNPGSPDETGNPYVAYPQRCVTKPIQYRGRATAFVDPRGGRPSVATLKQALLDHGPIAVFIYAGGQFYNHYNTDAVVYLSSGVGPHIVTIVGWDDNRQYPGGKGAWEIKNSWGPDWGREGFGWVRYGCSAIGYNAMWIETP